MNHLSLPQFFKLELKISSTLLLFAFLVSIFVSLMQGVIIWDGYSLMAVLLLGLYYLLSAILLAFLSSLGGRLLCGREQSPGLEFFGICFPSTLIASLYLAEAFHPVVALWFPGLPKSGCFVVFAALALLGCWVVWRFWLLEHLSSVGGLESVRNAILFLAWAAIWVFSMDLGFIREAFNKATRVGFALVWLVVLAFGFPLVRAVSKRLAASPSVFSLSKGSRVCLAVFLVLTAAYCTLLVTRYNPHSPDRYALSSHPLADPGERPNLLLFVLDTFRADHLFLGGEKLAPNLTSLFPDCIVFRRAYSPSSWTLPATRSILCSLYPTTALQKSSISPLALRSLAEILAENGYGTIGISENIVATGPLFAQGFDRYQAPIRYYLCRSLLLFRSLPYMAEKIILTLVRGYDLGPGRLASRIRAVVPNPPGGPLFLYVHFNEAHYPYYDDRSFLGGIYPGSGRLAWYSLLGQVHSGSGEVKVEPQKLQDMVGRYRQGIASLDQQLGGLFDWLRTVGLWDNSLVVITSDHGEEFLEHHSWGHGQSLYEELIHVPLLIKFPQGSGITPGVIENAVSTIDIAPTILDFLGRADLAVQMQGRSLLPLIRGEEGQGREFVFSERIEGGSWHKIYTLLQDSLKFILNESDGGAKKEELYNLRPDPGESLNLWRETEQFEEMKARCENFIAYLSGGKSQKASEFDLQTLEKLKAMGYLR